MLFVCGRDLKIVRREGKFYNGGKKGECFRYVLIKCCDRG